MKNQYIGDVGDYGKYGLLRFLRGSVVDVGVNWYLTPNDGGTDGAHTEYLLDERMRAYDPELFDAMGRVAFCEHKTIQMVEQDPALSGMRFYNELLDTSSLNWRDRRAVREVWHEAALLALREADLIFADPDNGLSATQRPTRKNSEKFILPNEVADYYRRGQQVVYYHHRPRKKPEAWLKDKRMMLDDLSEARLLALTFHRWSSRTYIFVVHEDCYARYSQLVEDFLATEWGSLRIDGKAAFTLESVTTV